MHRRAIILVQCIMVNNCERVDWGCAVWREHCKRWFSLEPAVPLSVTGGWLAVVIQYGTGDTVATWLLTNPKIQHGTKHHRLISSFSSNNFKWSDKTKAIDQTWMSKHCLWAVIVQQDVYKRIWKDKSAIKGRIKSDNRGCSAVKRNRNRTENDMTGCERQERWARVELDEFNFNYYSYYFPL